MGGTSIIEKTEFALFDGLDVPSNAGIINMDMYGYDAWIAEAENLRK